MTTTGLAFGSFDALNIGHIAALREAGQGCDELIIAVASDTEIMTRTGSAALVGIDERIELLTAFFPESRVEATPDVALDDLVERYDPSVLFVTDADAVGPISSRHEGLDVCAVVERHSVSEDLISLDGEILWVPA